MLEDADVALLVLDCSQDFVELDEKIGGLIAQYKLATIIILNKYDIPIPNIDEVGVFANNDFQNLYNELVNKGLKSQKDALEVGKQIEVLDIKDLKERMENTTPDIEKVFSFLEMGSEHHLNAFTRWLGY